jgi:hypothetical protein
MSDLNPPGDQRLEDCTTCRHHAKQKRPQPLWFEGEQMRTLDDDKDVIVCMGEGPHKGREMVSPVRCDAYSAAQKRAISPELEARMAAALQRAGRRGGER